MNKTVVVIMAIILPFLVGFVGAWWWTVFAGMLHGGVLPAVQPVGWKDLYWPSVWLGFAAGAGGLLKGSV